MTDSSNGQQPAPQSASPHLTKPQETSQDLTGSHETLARPVEIPEHLQVGIAAGVALAAGEGHSIGKSTLQRHAKRWHEAGEAASVKTVKVTNSTGTFYRLHREDFVSWVLERLAQEPIGEASQDLTGSHETSSDLTRQGSETGKVSPNSDSRYVEQIEQERERLLKQIDIKDGQIERANNQIDQLTATNAIVLERNKELHVLMQGLQKRIENLNLPVPDIAPSHEESGRSRLDN